MSEINNELNTEPEQNWSIVDDQGAEWALKKIAEAKKTTSAGVNSVPASEYIIIKSILCFRQNLQ